MSSLLPPYLPPAPAPSFKSKQEATQLLENVPSTQEQEQEQETAEGRNKKRRTKIESEMETKIKRLKRARSI